MSKKLTYEEVKEYIESFGYKLLSKEYVKNDKPLLIQCDCEHEPYLVRFNNFRNGRRCPYCANKNKGKYRKFTYEYVKKYIESLGYKLLSEEYKNNNEHLALQCPNGHRWDVRFSSFKNGEYRCPYCSGNIKRTLVEIKEYIESFGYELLSNEYENDKSKILIKCQNPNHKAYLTRFSAFKYQNNRCPYCYKEQKSEKQKFSYEYIYSEIEKEGYKMLSVEYEGAKNEIKIECPKGHKYKTRWNYFQQGKRCPKCKESKGEKRISDYLNSKNIKYETQYKINNCRFKQPLPFDFYLPDYDICIEYDGRQHYEIVEYFGGLDSFVDTKIRDTVKNEYCKNNNIKLIRIPYWDFDRIEDILIRELKLK